MNNKLNLFFIGNTKLSGSDLYASCLTTHKGDNTEALNEEYNIINFNGTDDKIVENLKKEIKGCDILFYTYHVSTDLEEKIKDIATIGKYISVNKKEESNMFINGTANDTLNLFIEPIVKNYYITQKIIGNYIDSVNKS
jgi:hypothetical protein